MDNIKEINIEENEVIKEKAKEGILNCVDNSITKNATSFITKSDENTNSKSEKYSNNMNPKGVGDGFVVENESCVIPTKANNSIIGDLNANREISANGEVSNEKNKFVASCINGNYPRRVIDIVPENLTNEILKTKYEGFRLVQMCAVNQSDGTIMLNYSFGRDYELLCYHLNIDIKTPVMSISEIFPPAFLYENEMHDLFGINIEHISLDYKGNLYRLKDKTPYLRKEKE